MLNKAQIIGSLGADPEVKTTPNGNTVAKLSVATNRTWTDKGGEKQEKTEWHRIVVWGAQAAACGKYLAKGRQVYVEGRIETRSWENDQGQKVYTTEIIAETVQFLGGGKEKDSGPRFDSNAEIPF